MQYSGEMQKFQREDATSEPHLSKLFLSVCGWHVLDSRGVADDVLLDCPALHRHEPLEKLLYSVDISTSWS